jgi:uncharacterized protein YhdP
MQGADLAEVLKAWNFAATATSKRFSVDADIRWPGSPARTALARLSGTLDASMSEGRFLEVSPGAQTLRVFSLVNFAAIGQRLRLDFSDVFGAGLVYEEVKGLLTGQDGVFVTTRPLTVTAPTGRLKLDGSMNFASDRIDAGLSVSVPVTNSLPMAALLAGAPVVAGAIFVVDKLLGSVSSNLLQVQYRIKGPIADPQITFDKPF